MRLSRPTFITACAGALTLASITGTAGYTIGRYTGLPAALIAEFRRDEVPYFIPKTYWIVLTPVWTQLILAAVFGCICAALLWRAHGTAREDQSGADAVRMVQAAEAVSLLALVWISFQALTAVGLMRLWTHYWGGMGSFYDFGLYTALVASVLIATRAKMQIGRPANSHSQDAGVWRMRELYCNPADPSLFVPARRGRGLTVNFGRPLALVFLLIVLLAGLGAPIIVARALLR